MEDAESLLGNISSRRDLTDSTRLVCPLCLKDFLYPRILPCMDTFCHTCLTTYLRQSAPKRNIYGFFECPACTTLIYVPVQEKGALKWASMFPFNTSVLRFTAYGRHKQLGDIEKEYNSSMIDIEASSDRNSGNITAVIKSPKTIREASCNTTITTTTSPKTSHKASFNATTPKTSHEASFNATTPKTSHEAFSTEAEVQKDATEVHIADKEQNKTAQNSTLTEAPVTQDLIEQSLNDNLKDTDLTTARTDRSFYSSVVTCKVCLQTSCKGCTTSEQYHNDMMLENIDSKMENSSLPSCFHQLFKCAEHYGRENNYLCHDHGVVCCVRCKSRHRRCEKFTKLGQYVNTMMTKTSSRDLLIKLFQIEEDFNKLVEINELNLQVFHGRIRDMPNEISRLEGRINDVIYNSLQIKIKKEGSEVFDVESERKLDEIRKCKSLVASIRMCTNILEIVNNLGSVEELFLVVNKSEQKLLKYKEQMDRIVSQMRIVELNFRLNPVIREFMTLDEHEMLQLQVKEESRDGLVKRKIKANEKVKDTETKSRVKNVENFEASSKFNLPPLSDKIDRSVNGINNKKNVNMKKNTSPPQTFLNSTDMKQNTSLPQLSDKPTDIKKHNGKQLKPTRRSSNNKLSLDKTSQIAADKNTESKMVESNLKLLASNPNEKVSKLEIDNNKTEIPFKIETFMEFIAITPINYDGKSRFTGATFLPDDQILLIDNVNCRCCLYDSSCLFRSVHYLPFPPQSVCYVTKNKVAIAVPTCQVIQMVRVKMDMDERGRIPIDFRCWAVAALKSDQLALSGFTKETGVCCWGIYKTKGKKIHYRELENENKGGGTTHIAVNQTKNIIYISFSATDAVYSFAINGNLRFSYVNTDLKNPHGVDVDRRDFLFILGWMSQNLHIVNPEGVCLKVLKRVIPVSPRQIAFNQLKDKFIVTHGKNFSEDCFILSIVEKENGMKQ
ncbi:hypothetical protein CHS0354_002399 [Potamilus streckersoni]|uniref:RING-type domain-containing protein n=1 Tax=Potamilus streckersoni TaxID=2493646 RepID=A0AAE0VIP4_9BIVA|nr:hypothetical protein CHS0354_002399 [Potamilus streckersoni]